MWQHVAAVALVLMLVWQAFEAGRSSGRWQRLCLVVATALASYVILRAGLTRHDDGHLVLFTGYVVVLGAALVLGTVRGRRHWVGLAALVVAFALQTWMLPGRDWLRPIDRTDSLDSLARTASVLMDDRARDSLLDAARTDLAERYAISPDLVEALRGDKVTADPWDVSAVWAADADWQPVPGILPINAYHAAPRPREHGAPRPASHASSSSRDSATRSTGGTRTGTRPPIADCSTANTPGPWRRMPGGCSDPSDGVALWSGATGRDVRGPGRGGGRGAAADLGP